MVMPGAPEETLDDRFRLWGLVAEKYGTEKIRDVPPRAREVGDLLGNTVAALLDFFQPYPGDELIPWSDVRRDAVRFRVMRPSQDVYVIDDAYFDEVTVLPMECLRQPTFHLFQWYACQRATSLLGIPRGVTYP